MIRAKVLVSAVLLIFAASNSLALNLNLSKQQESKAIAFADSALECGIYYQYTANGLKKNPNVSRETVQSTTQNSKTLLHTADLLYDAAGISTADKREEFLRKADIMLKERAETPGSINQLIYEFGEKCKLLLTSYSYRIKNIATESNPI